MTFVLLLFVQDDPGALVERLRSEGVEEREDAARRLKLLGLVALPALEKATHDGDTEVSNRASQLSRVIRTLSLLTPNLVKRMPGIEDRLSKDDDHEWTLACLSADSSRVADPGIKKADLEALIVRAFQGARSTDEKKSLCRLVERHHLGVAAGEVSKLFDLHERTEDPWVLRHSPNRDLKQAALSVLEALGDRSRAPRVAELLKEKDDRLASKAAELLVDWKATEVLPRLASMIDEEEIYPALALSLFRGLDARQALPQVVRLLREKEAGDQAAELVADWQARETTPRLIKLLGHRDVDVRRRAVLLLAEFESREAIPELLRTLREDPYDRTRTTETLVELKAKEAVPELLALLKEGDSRFSSDVLRALGRLGAKEALPEVLARLGRSEPPERTPLQALADLGAVEAVPELLEWIKDREPQRRYSGALGLGKVGGPESIPALAGLLRDPDKRVRCAALDALADLDARNEIPAIESRMADPEPQVRHRAIWTLERMGAKESVPSLCRAAAGPDVGDAGSAIHALGHLGQPEAIPTLVVLLKEGKHELRLEVANALTRLGSREGVDVLLAADLRKEYPDLNALNALRQPDLWKRLRNQKLGHDLEGTNRHVWDQISREAGLTIDVERRLGFARIFRNRGRMSVLQAIEELAWHQGLVLDPDRTRIEGITFWKEWWEKERHPK